MAYDKPQARITQEFTQIPAEITDPLRPLVLGGNADLHRYADADEKPLISVGEYDPEEDACHDYPARTPGSVVDQDYIKVFVDKALLLYFTDQVEADATITPVAGYANRITADTLRFKTSGAYARSAAFKDRDVKVRDVAYVRGVYDPEDTCEEIELWTEVAGFAAAVIDGAVDVATVDEDNQETQTLDVEIIQVAGEENCVTATADAADYNGLAAGDVDEEYTIEVVQSAIAGCNAARLRVTSASGNDDVEEVTPEDFGDPTAIGTRGLLVTFSNTGSDDCSSEASAADVAPTAFVLGQTWRVTVNQAFEAVKALSGGTYDGAKNDKYIVEVTKGGLWADLPEITVRTTKGLDFSGPTEVVDGNTDIPIGQHGVTIRFFGSEGGAGDVSIGADEVAGLRKGDKFYVPVTAPTTGPVDVLLLKHDLPVRLREATDLELRLYIKSDIELAADRISDAPNTNWYSEETQICVQEGALAYDDTWTDDGEKLPLPIKGGEVFIEYREWLAATVAQMNSVQKADDLDDIPGPLDPDNPLKYGMYCALQLAGGAGVRGVGVRDPKELDDWVHALEILDGDDTFYNFAPMTFDKAVHDLVLTQANNESSPTANNWKACFFSLLGATSKRIVSSLTSTDGEEVLATISDNPAATGTQYSLLQVPAGNGQFVTNGVVSGDVVRYLYSTDGFDNESYTEFLVDDVLSEDAVLLFKAHTVAVNEPQKVEIYHPLSKSEQAVDLAAKGAAYGSMRACAVWPDEYVSGGRTLPGYYLAALAAGYAGGVAPHRSLTNAVVTGVDSLPKSFGYFNNTQLNRIAEGGVFIFAEDRDGVPHIRDGLTTDMTSLNKRKEMYRRNVDAISLYFNNRIKSYIGQANVTDTFISKLRRELKEAIAFLKQNSKTDDLGPQLIEGLVISAAAHPLNRDQIEVYLRLTLPFELGILDLYLAV